ncbi:MAG TPA: hypothetical protein VFJ82_20555, partial [Longimicrobium sp.]|nr:hypothetical protein [Longimicrobium sp.]
LPPHARVTWAHFHPWSIPPEPFDLLVMGIGNSLYKPLLTDRLLALLDRAPVAVGIFGTQYPALTRPERVAPVLDRLHTWYARSRADTERYGGRCRTVHLGDWLIDLFPMARGTDPETLRVDRAWADGVALDRAIQRIQRHQRVHSTRLHALLCALTSAAAVAYSEQPFRGFPSGKFAALLRDVFGREYPPEEFFPVDRDAVVAYKTHVRRQLRRLRRDLARLLPPAAARG